MMLTIVKDATLAWVAKARMMTAVAEATTAKAT